jgi:hypothetical protein
MHDMGPTSTTWPGRHTRGSAACQRRRRPGFPAQGRSPLATAPAASCTSSVVHGHAPGERESLRSGRGCQSPPSLRVGPWAGSWVHAASGRAAGKVQALRLAPSPCSPPLRTLLCHHDKLQEMSYMQGRIQTLQLQGAAQPSPHARHAALTLCSLNCTAAEPAVPRLLPQTALRPPGVVLCLGLLDCLNAVAHPSKLYLLP